MSRDRNQRVSECLAGRHVRICSNSRGIKSHFDVNNSGKGRMIGQFGKCGLAPVSAINSYPLLLSQWGIKSESKVNEK